MKGNAWKWMCLALQKNCKARKIPETSSLQVVVPRARKARSLAASDLFSLQRASKGTAVATRWPSREDPGDRQDEKKTIVPEWGSSQHLLQPGTGGSSPSPSAQSIALFQSGAWRPLCSQAPPPAPGGPLSLPAPPAPTVPSQMPD